MVTRFRRVYLSMLDNLLHCNVVGQEFPFSYACMSGGFWLMCRRNFSLCNDRNAKWCSVYHHRYCVPAVRCKVCRPGHMKTSDVREVSFYKDENNTCFVIFLVDLREVIDICLFSSSFSISFSPALSRKVSLLAHMHTDSSRTVHLSVIRHGVWDCLMKPA